MHCLIKIFILLQLPDNIDGELRLKVAEVFEFERQISQVI